MSRIFVIGLTALILAACGPADQSAPPPAAAAPAAPTGAPQSSASPPSASPPSASQPSAAMSWGATQERYRQVEVEPSDPLEALEYRAVHCQHYSGEFGGDNSERDQWLNAQMDQLRCGALVVEARAMRAARSSEPDALSRLNAVIAVYEG